MESEKTRIDMMTQWLQRYISISTKSGLNSYLMFMSFVTDREVGLLVQCQWLNAT